MVKVLGAGLWIHDETAAELAAMPDSELVEFRAAHEPGRPGAYANLRAAADAELERRRSTGESVWSGAPHPDSPDSAWIDDETGESVCAHCAARAPTLPAIVHAESCSKESSR